MSQKTNKPQAPKGVQVVKFKQIVEQTSAETQRLLGQKIVKKYARGLLLIGFTFGFFAGVYTSTFF